MVTEAKFQMAMKMVEAVLPKKSKTRPKVKIIILFETFR